MVVEARFYGAAGSQIRSSLGGKQLLLYDKEWNTRIMIDFGIEPDRWSYYYGFPWRPQKSRLLDIGQYFALLPKIPGIYREDWTKKTADSAIEFIFTHMHYDHTAGITALDASMPLHMSVLTTEMLYIWQNLSGRTINQFIDLYQDNALGRSSTGEEKFLESRLARIERNIKRFVPGDPFYVGRNEVTAHSVDHSSLDAVGFIIDSSIGKIADGGDFRSRGRRPEDTERFLQKCLDEKIKYFIFEGSLLHFEHEGTEEDVTNAVIDVGKDKALLTISFPPRDFDRLTSLYYAAVELNRMLVITMGQAIYLKALNGMYGFPKLNWKNIGIYVPPMSHRTIDDPFYGLDLTEKDYRIWQRKFVKIQRWKENEDKIQRVSYEDIRDNQDKFLVTVSGNSAQLADLLSQVHPSAGSLDIRSNPQGWTDEMRAQDEKRVKVAQDFGMHSGPKPDYFVPSIQRDMETIHVPGHHNSRETKKILERLCERDITIIPNHTLDPNRFKELAPAGAKIMIPDSASALELK